MSVYKLYSEKWDCNRCNVLDSSEPSVMSRDETERDECQI